MLELSGRRARLLAIPRSEVNQAKHVYEDPVGGINAESAGFDAGIWEEYPNNNINRFIRFAVVPKLQPVSVHLPPSMTLYTVNSNTRAKSPILLTPAPNVEARHRLGYGRRPEAGASFGSRVGVRRGCPPFR